MRPLRISPTAFVLLALVCAVSLSHAADTTGMPNLTDGSDSTTAAATTTDAAKTTDSSKPSSTDSAAKTTDMPSTTKSSKGGLTDLPTLSGGYKYPPASVPPTANAPYMQHSNLPEGTVFIVVGAALGFLGLAVLAWRGFLAWSLHRSVRRAATYENARESKAMLRAPGAGFYSAHGGRNSSLSLDALSSTPITKHASRPKSMPPPRDSLFFSPTAGAAQQYAQQNNNNRASTYLPAGYYATGSAQAGGGSTMSHLGGGGGGGNGSSYNLSPGHAYSRSRSSPPSSPGLSPQRSAGGGGGMYRDSTYSRLSNPAAGNSHESLNNLSSPPQGRAPSAYLEDLFETHQADTPGGGGRI